MSSDDDFSVLKLPLGERFLDLLVTQEERCMADTTSQIRSLGKTTPKTIENLGTVLSLLDRVGSCYWGCAGGDHVPEYVTARCASTARASLRLLYHGYYDESLSLTRSLAEAANLLFLFFSDPSAFRASPGGSQSVTQHFLVGRVLCYTLQGSGRVGWRSRPPMGI